MLEKRYNHHLSFRLASTPGEVNKLLAMLPPTVRADLKKKFWKPPTRRKSMTSQPRPPTRLASSGSDWLAGVGVTFARMTKPPACWRQLSNWASR